MKAFASLAIAMFVAGFCSTLFAGILMMLLSVLNPNPSSLWSYFIPMVGLTVPLHLYLVWRFYGTVRRRFGEVA
jgi:hypothetical protein